MITEYPTYEAFHSSDSCKEGNCTQCGLCCIAFRVIVPSKEGNPDSPTTVKHQGDICPQLQGITHGKYRCVLHDKKDHKALVTCRDWNGNVVRWDTGSTQYTELCRATARWICYPDSLEQVRTIDALIKNNKIPTDTVELVDQIFSRPENISLVLKRYIAVLKVLPTNIFKFLRLNVRFNDLDAIERRRVLNDIKNVDPVLVEKLNLFLKQ